MPGMMRQILLGGVLGLVFVAGPVPAVAQPAARRPAQTVDAASRAAILRAQQAQAAQRAYSVGLTMTTTERPDGIAPVEMASSRLVHVAPDRYHHWETSGVFPHELVKIGTEIWSRNDARSWKPEMDASTWGVLRSPPALDAPGYRVTEAIRSAPAEVNGIRCARYQYALAKGDETYRVTMWVSPTLNLPIKYTATGTLVGKGLWTWEIVYDSALTVERPVDGATCAPGSDCQGFRARIQPRPGPVPTPDASPREVVAAWLLAPTMDDALKFLIASTAETWRIVRAGYAVRSGHLTRMMDLSLVPGPTLAATGATGRVRGQPVSGVGFFGGRVLDVTFDRDEITADRAIVHLHAEVGLVQPVAGQVELVRGEAGWRIAAADIGPEIRHSYLDKPNAVSAVVERVMLPLQRARTSMLRAQAIGALRAVSNAQNTFEDANAGFGGPLECLTAPRTCLPTYPADSPPPLGEVTAQGYTPTFVAGASPSAAELRQTRASARSLKSWAYVLVPIDTSAGQESLCIDSTARMCTFTGAATLALGGACPASCVDLK